jgi:hypothetical protein
VLYRVRIGEDDYLGQAEEVVGFMAQAEGAPGDGIESYMEGVAARLREELGIQGVATDDPSLFLDSLDEKGVISVQTFAEPSDDRVSPEEALGDGLVSLGDGVDPRDVDSL